MKYYEEGHEGEEQVATEGTFSVEKANTTYYLTIPPENVLYFNSYGYEQEFEILQWGDVHWTTFAYAFQGVTNLEISATDVPDLSQVESMERAFFMCTIMNSPNLSKWDVSNVTNMSLCFYECEFFDQDLSGWHVENVTNMEGMFQFASSFSQSLTTWGDRVQKVTNMGGMFYGSAFNEPMGHWKLENVSYFSLPPEMSDENYVATLRGWAAQKKEERRNDLTIYAEGKCYVGAEAERQRLITESGWDFHKDYGTPFTPTGNEAFVLEYKIKERKKLVVPVWGNDLSITWRYLANPVIAGGVEHFSATSPADFYHFDATAPGTYEVRIAPTGVRTFTWGDLGKSGDNVALTVRQWGSVAWSTTEDMFMGCSDLEIPTTAGVPDLSHVTSCSSMFARCTNFNSDISAWDVSRVGDMSGMFAFCKKFNQSLEDWDVSSVYDLSYTFRGCSAFNQPLNGWGKKMKGLLSINGIFEECTTFNQPLDQWDVSRVDMYNSFTDASAFNQDLSSWKPGDLNYIYFDGSGLSTENYSKLLKAWAELPSFRGVTLYMGSCQFSADAVSARNVLCDEKRCKIYDGGLAGETPSFAFGIKTLKGNANRYIPIPFIACQITPEELKNIQVSNEKVRHYYEDGLLRITTSDRIDETVTFTIPANGKHGALSASLHLKMYHEANFSGDRSPIYLQPNATAERTITIDGKDLNDEERAFDVKTYLADGKTPADAYLKLEIEKTSTGAKLRFSPIKPYDGKISVVLFLKHSYYNGYGSQKNTVYTVRWLPELKDLAFAENPLNLCIGETKRLDLSVMLGDKTLRTQKEFQTIGGLDWEVTDHSGTIKLYGNQTLEAFAEGSAQITAKTRTTPQLSATLTVNVEKQKPGHRLLINHPTLTAFTYKTTPADLTNLQPGQKVMISITSEKLDLQTEVTGTDARCEVIENGRSYAFYMGSDEASLTFSQTPKPTYQLALENNTGLTIHTTSSHDLNHLEEGEEVQLTVDNTDNKELIVTTEGVSYSVLTPNQSYKVTMGRRSGTITFNLKPVATYAFTVNTGTTGLSYTTDPSDCHALAYGAKVTVKITNNAAGKKLTTTLVGKDALLDVKVPHTEYQVTMGSSAAVLTIDFVVETPTYSVTFDASALAGLVVQSNPRNLTKLYEGQEVYFGVDNLAAEKQLEAQVTEGDVLPMRTDHETFRLTVGKANIKIKLTVTDKPQAPLAKHTVSLASSITNGTVNLSHTTEVEEKTLVQLSTVPTNGYKPGRVTVYKKGDPTTQVEVKNNAFLMPAFDVEVNAEFVSVMHQIAIDPSITDGTLSTTPASPVKEGSLVRIIAQPTNSTTHKLRENSVRVTTADHQTVSVNPDLSFTMPEKDVTVTAQFVPTTHTEIVYHITITENEHGIIKTSPKTQAAEGQEVIVSLTGKEGYAPDYSSLTVKETTTQNTVNIYDGNKFRMPAAEVVISASFVTKTYTIESEVAHGTLQLSKTSAAEGTTITVTATGDNGYTLSPGSLRYYNKNNKKIGAAITGTSFTMPAYDVVVTAEFVVVPSLFEVTVTNQTPTFGTLSVSPASPVKQETKMTITASQNDGYIFDPTTLKVHKKGDANTTVTVTNMSFTMPAYDVVVTGGFKTVPTYAVEVATVDNGTLSVDKSTAAVGVTVTVTGTPSDPAKYELVSNSIVVTKKGDANTTVTVSGNTFVMPDYPVTVTAQFGLRSYTVTAKAGITNGKITFSSAKAKVGETVTLEAKPTDATKYELKAGSLIAYKKGVTTETVTITDKTFTMPAYDVEVSAEFVLKVTTYSVTLRSTGQGEISIKDYTKAQLEAVPAGTELEVVESHNEGWKLTKLLAGDRDILATKKFVVNGDITVTATFEDQGGAVEDTLLAGIAVAPNPFTSQLRIQNPEELTARYELVNASGVVVRAGVLCEKELVVDTEALASGLYFVRIATQNGAQKVVRVIK